MKSLLLENLKNGCLQSISKTQSYMKIKRLSTNKSLNSDSNLSLNGEDEGTTLQELVKEMKTQRTMLSKLHKDMKIQKKILYQLSQANDVQIDKIDE